MRIDRLDLTAFGPFTQLTLDLSAPGVHLVSGPNEAGKSTALRALDQLLFGFDAQSPYDFVHARASLRLSALLRGSDGIGVEVTRTRARQPTLRADDGSVLEAALLDVLRHRIDHTTFTSVFALNSAELRKGGQNLAGGGGDFGHALAATRSGNRLTEILRTLDRQIKDLYKHQGSKPVINSKLIEFKNARTRMREASLPPRDYTERHQAVSTAEQSLADLDTELKQARGEHSHLKLLSDVLPSLHRRQEFLDQIDALNAEGPLATQEAVDRLAPLLHELRAADDSLADSRRRLEETALKLDELIVDEDLLGAQNAIENLFQDRKAAAEAAQRLARFAGTATKLRTEAQALLQQVYPGAQLTETTRYTVPASLRSRAVELHEERTRADTALKQSRKAFEQRRRALEDTGKRLSELPATEDSGPLRAILDAIPHDLLGQIAGIDEDAQRIRSGVEHLLHDLRLQPLTVQEVTALSVPTRAQIEAHIAALSDLKHERGDLTKRTKNLNKQLAANRLSLATLLNNDPPPSEDDLLEVRSLRDVLWQEINAGRSERCADFEQAIVRADRLADQMRKDAHRIAERYRMELQIGSDERELGELDEEQADLRRYAEKLDAEWSGLWQDFPGPLPLPAAALTTLDDVRKLREAFSELSTAQARLASFTGQAHQHIERLREGLREPHGSTLLGTHNALVELPELRETAAARLSLQEKTAGEHATMRERLALAQAELTAVETQISEHEQDLTDWQAEWDTWLTRVDLPADHDTADALADLERLHRVAALMTDALTSEQESQHATAVIERFHTLLQTTSAACGRRFPDNISERDQLVAALYDEAKANRSHFEQRAILRSAHDELLSAVAGFRQTSQRLTTELTGLVRASKVDDHSALAEAVRRRQRHILLSANLEQVIQAIPARGDKLDALISEAADADGSRLEAQLAELTDRITDLDRQRTQQAELTGSKKTELAQLDGSPAAARAAAEAEISVAALIEESEEYLRLQVARTIVTRCMEDYLQAQQDPILLRASDLFTRLTLGRFSGLELDHEHDAPLVLARRGSELLSVNQLSEGTTDQLYLALRLASLERYAEEDRTLPFTVDDIFITFDDHRTRAALAILNEMADRFQMIVFTHHPHLIDLARQELPAGRLHVHYLPVFTPGRSDASPPQSTERLCRTCQQPLAYSGRGRPPVECETCNRTRR
ncbi:AAA family ATPase [Streptosporangium sp. NPDC049046]|uniref:AAA family ATPase n=1 Tax=unclassified Streptosporangium TaxID=2632669 RepID=UPI00343D447A